MITIQNLSKHFGEKIAVDNVTMEIKQGEIFGLLRRKWCTVKQQR